jgi:SAM-dependent methyltransferase
MLPFIPLRRAAGIMHVMDGVREAYDAVAPKYAAQFADELDHKPFDRAMLSAFAEQVTRQGGPGHVADIGCGPGHVTAHLASLGLAAHGLDLSPAMIRLARGSHPGLSFAVGQMPRLPYRPGGLAGAVLFYSIIHLAPDQRAATFAALARALRPGGLMLVAFHLGENTVKHVDNWFGEPVSFDGYLLPVELVASEIAAAGLEVDVVATRAPYPRAETSGTRRGYLQATMPR